jgi:hypothetical protein
VGVVLVGAGTTFTVHDGLAASNPPPASHGWSAAETGIATPIAALLDIAMIAATHKRSDAEELEAFLAVPTIWANALAAHGIWALRAPQSDTALLLGGSWAIGANAVFTVAAIGGASGRRLPGLPFGVIEMVGTAPSIAVGAYELASPARPFKPAFAGLTVWSGVLFTHGLASLSLGIRKKLAEPKDKEKPPEGAGASAWPRFTFTPTVLAGGPVPAHAFVLGGVF